MINTLAAPTESSHRTAQLLTLSGQVQGVGLRPTLYRLAQQHSLSGWVRNSGSHVTVLLVGLPHQVEALLTELTTHTKLSALIDIITQQPLSDAALQQLTWQPNRFELRTEESSDPTDSLSCGTLPKDLAPCHACLEEFKDPNNRRFRYPFISCAECGPRYTLVQQLPFERKNTSLAAFPLCTHCQHEYDTPTDRRFHAQTISCPACGPKLQLFNNNVGNGALEAAAAAETTECAAKQFANPEHIVATTTKALRAGQIVMVKGVGGYQWLCSATHTGAIAKLRALKRRPKKPFALLVPTLSMAQSLADLTPQEIDGLTSSARPIVLAKRKKSQSHGSSSQTTTASIRATIPINDDAVHPDAALIGLMLPSSPLHYLLAEQMNAPLIITSANQPNSPMVTTLDEALTLCPEEAMLILSDNRAIHHRLDDSIVRFINNVQTTLRLGRGLAPFHCPRPARQSTQSAKSDQALTEALTRASKPNPPCIAVGGPDKNSFAWLTPHQLIDLGHIGNLNSCNALTAANKTVLQQQPLLYGQIASSLDTPSPNNTLSQAGDSQIDSSHHNAIHWIGDRHPDYAATQFARQQCNNRAGHFHEIQHHHAHIAACAAEHQFTDRCLALTWDGLGLGLDRQPWGGELFYWSAPKQTIKRVATLQPWGMLGGDRAATQPRYAALGMLQALANHHHTSQENAAVLRRQLSRLQAQFEPMTWTVLMQHYQAGHHNHLRYTSMGRLFDAVAALLTGCFTTHYEAEAALALEALTDSTEPFNPLPYEIYTNNDRQILDWRPAVMALFNELDQNNPNPRLLSTRFHQTLIAMAAQAIEQLASIYKVTTVIFSGGVFQNDYLTTVLIHHLPTTVQILTHQKLPPNDGGLSIGQLYHHLLFEPSSS